MNAKLIFNHEKNDDGLAKQLVRNIVDVLGKAIAMVTSVCVPEVIIVGGGVSAAGNYLLDQIRNRFLHPRFSWLSECQISPCKVTKRCWNLWWC